VILAPFTAAEEIAPLPEFARRIGEIVARDLDYSGIFRVTERTSGGGTMADSAARPVGEAEITAEVSRGSKGLRLVGTLVEPVSRRTIRQLRYEFEGATLRATAHHFSDDIVNTITGERGIAQTRIAFVAKTKEGQELYVIDYDGEGLRQVTRDRSIALSPSWSPDGEAILYTSFKKGSVGVYWIRPDGGSGGVVSLEPGLNTAAAWSGDGRRIAMSLSKDGNSEIYTVRRDATSLTRLTNNRAIDTAPTWSPDGRQIAFTSDRTGAPQIFVMDSDGANSRRVTFEGDYNDSPAWAPLPDDPRIAYAARTNTGFDIYLLDVASGATAAVTTGDAVYEDPTWGPDARHLAASRRARGGRAIVVMETDGAEMRVVTPNSLDAFAPSWSSNVGSR
jgi:TolB protein